MMQRNGGKKKDQRQKKKNLVSNREVRHQKIQLWSNVYESEYALRLAIAAADDNSEESFLVKTDPKARYTHIVAESDYLEDFREGWEYTLRHFIEHYKEAIQQHPKEEYLRKNKPMSSNVYRSSSKARLDEEAKTDQPNHYPIKLISYLRCHYCNLEFHDVEERREHELEWHV
jgi:hypothetical protein